MKKKNNISLLKRHTYTVWALVLLLASVIPAIQNSKVHAYSLLQKRFIQMSSSSPGDAANGSGTNVIYKVNFRVTTASFDPGSIQIEFCSNNPIIDESGTNACYAPTGFDINKNNTTVNTIVGLGALTKDLLRSTANKLVLTRTTGTALAVAPNDLGFTLGTGTGGNGITNPTEIDSDLDTVNSTNGPTPPVQVGTFFARITLYTSTDASGAAVEAGGAALSTTDSVTITSKVTERLQFCVYTGFDCSAGAGGIILGDTNGVLDPGQVFVNKETRYSIQSNAAQSTIIRVKGPTLTTSGFTISAIGGTAQQVNALSGHIGTEQFGFCTYTSSGPTGTGVSGALNAVTPYGGQSGGLAPASPPGQCNGTSDTSGNAVGGGDNDAYFAFDDTATTSTYGAPFAQKEAGGTTEGTIVFAANIANTTEAGIYSTTLNFIATGQY